MKRSVKRRKTGHGYRFVYDSEDSLMLTFDRQIFTWSQRLALAIDAFWWVLSQRTPSPKPAPKNQTPRS